MFNDRNMRVATAQAVTVTAVSTDSVDLSPSTVGGNQAPDFGEGQQMFMIVTLNTAGTPGAGTLAIEWITSAAAALTSPIVIGQSTVRNDEDYVAGMAPIVIGASPDINGLQARALRFMGANFVAAVAMPAGYTFTVDYVVNHSDGLRFYASGFTVA